MVSKWEGSGPRTIARCACWNWMDWGSMAATENEGFLLAAVMAAGRRWRKEEETEGLQRERERERERSTQMEGWDPSTKSTLTQIPLLATKAGPRDGGAWTQRLKEEYKALIAYTQMNKSNDNDWFRISAANPEGTRWTGKCWYVHNLLKYEFDLQFDIPVTYPATAPEIELPQLDGKTQKMYRGGKICLTVHFKPLWAKNCPRFGIAHALCLGLAPWLAAEVPILVESGMIKHKDDAPSSNEP